jgi:hypothetical protein
MDLEDGKMYKLKIAILIILAAVMMTACGNSREETTTILLHRDGSVQHTIVEDFNSSDGSISDLTKVILQKITTFNGSSSEGKVSVTKIEADGKDKVRVVMKYPDLKAFQKFNNEDASAKAPSFFGTVEQAYQAGYDLSKVTVYQNGDTSKALSGDDILALGSQHILIYDNALNSGAEMQIKVYEKISYCSNNVTCNEKTASVKTKSGELVYLILK